MKNVKKVNFPYSDVISMFIHIDIEIANSLTNEHILENICSSLLRAGVNFTKLFLLAKIRRRTAENLPFNFTNKVKVKSLGQNSPNLSAIRQKCSPKSVKFCAQPMNQFRQHFPSSFLTTV
jgi:hypothetical protein